MLENKKIQKLIKNNPHVRIMFFGVLNIITGITQVVTLGYYSGDIAMMYCTYELRRRYGKTQQNKRL